MNLVKTKGFKGNLILGLIVSLIVCFFFSSSQLSAQNVTPAAGGIGSTIQDTFPDPGLAQSVADIISGGDINHVITQEDVDNTLSLTFDGRIQITDLTGISVFSNLNYLSVFQNWSLEVIPDEILTLTDLTHLSVRYNSIKTLPADLGNLTNLDYLDISANPLTSFPNSIWNLSNLYFLNISNLGEISLTELPDVFDQLPLLRNFLASGHSLTDLPPSLWDLPQLEILDLSSNQIPSLPPDISKLDTLRIFNVENNQLTVLPEELWTLTNIYELYFSHNQLTELSPSIGNLVNLQILRGSNNQITGIPDTFGDLINLYNLDLSYNQIPVIPDTFGNLASLRYFYFWSNQITALPDTISNLDNLMELFLGSNKITEVTPSIGDLASLTVLDLSNNQLTEVPPEIGNLSTLQRISLNSNQISVLPDNFWNLSSLNSLDISDNLFTTIPSDLGKLTNLVILSANQNKLEVLPEVFDSLTNFSELHVAHNLLVVLPESIDYSKMSRMSVESNQLTNLPDGFSNYPPSVSWGVYLADNLFPAGYSDMLNTLLNTTSFYEAGQERLIIDTPMVFDIRSQADIDGINYGDYLRLNSSQPLSNTHKYKMVNYKDEFGNDVNIDDYILNGTVIKSGKVFANVMIEGTTGVFSPDSNFPTTDEQVELNFIFQAPSFNLAFDLNGGEGTPPATQQVEEGTLGTPVTDPSRTGFTFSGWNTAADGTGTTWDFTTTLMPANDVTLFAQWEKKNEPVSEFTLRFDLNGGSGITPSNQVLNEGQKAQQPANPTREGYTFKGWNDSKDGTGLTWDFPTTTMPGKDVTLYAHWIKNDLPQTGSNAKVIALGFLLTGIVALSIVYRRKIKLKY